MFFYFVYCLLCSYLVLSGICAITLLITYSPLTFKQELLMVLHGFCWPMLYFNPDRFHKISIHIKDIIDPFDYILKNKEGD